MTREEAEAEKTPGTYGFAASKKKKQPYHYAVFVHKGTKERQVLPCKIFSAFKKLLWDTRLGMSTEENDRICIEWLYHLNGMGVITCLDSHSAAFIQKLAASFRFPPEMTTIRAWNKWERSQAILFKFYIHSVFIKTLKKDIAMTRILKMNGLEGNFIINRWDTKSKNGVFCELEPKGKLLWALANKKRLKAPSCSIILEKKIRREMTETEYIENAKKYEAKSKFSNMYLCTYKTLFLFQKEQLHFSAEEKLCMQKNIFFLQGGRSMMRFLDGCCTNILTRFIGFEMRPFNISAKPLGINGCCTTFWVGAAAVFFSYSTSVLSILEL